MDDPISRGHAFVVGDLWRAQSPFLQAQEELRGSIFEALDTSSIHLEIPISEEAPHFRFDADLPELPHLDVTTEPPVDSQEAALPSGSHESHNLDIWSLDDASLKLPESPCLCTWEAFDGKSIASSKHIALLSEAGQAAFDALNVATNKDGVLPQDYTLRALCSLAHGRSSTLFQWSQENRSFQSVLPGVSPSGISLVCAESVTKDMIAMGTLVVRLTQFGDTAYSSRTACSAVVAMQNSIISVLDAIDEILCRHLSGMRSLLQLQQLLVRPRQLLATLITLVESVQDCRTDEALISVLSDQIHALATTNYEHSSVLQAILARVSVPWLERLSTELGFCNDMHALLSVQSLDEDSAEEHTFLDNADIDLIRDTKMAVTLLRDLIPTHSLLGGSSSPAESPLESFTNPDLSLHRSIEIARQYDARMMQQMTDIRTFKQVVPRRVFEAQLDTGRADEISQESYIAELDDVMWQDISQRPQVTPDQLHTLVGLICRIDSIEERGCNSDVLACSSSTPLERVRPFVETQSRLVNGILLRQILRNHQLRQHLEQQKQFQLLGSGDFVTRLSTALFSLEVQSAERKNGVVPTGEVMGLRLGSSSDQRWPPASSELRLTLAGVLEESQGTRSATSESRTDQSGSLSFAIRELPEEEIDRVLDVHSVHALDFLRLQYVPTSPLDSILTPEAIQQYDIVFRFLLKLLRQIHIVKSLPRMKSGGRGDASNERIISFANESHHFVSVLMAHSMELGINAPWCALMTSIEQLEQALKEEDTAGEIGTRATVGIQGLKQMHEACLDRIRGRLLLKRKHTKLRVGIEAVFAAILQSAVVLTASGTVDRSAFEERYVVFQQACSQLCEMLQQVIEKPPKVNSAAESEDADTIRLLFLKLNWNDFYLSP